MNNNPFSPPKADLREVSSQNVAISIKLVYTVAAIFAIQLAIFLYCSGIYFELVRTGVIAAIGPFLGCIAEALLFLAIVRLFLKHRPKILFLVSGVGAALASSLTWHIQTSLDLIFSTFIFGAVLSFFGCWVTFTSASQDI